MFGDIGLENMIEGDDVTYLYPDFITGLKVNTFEAPGRLIFQFCRDVSSLKD